jgi:NAD(P)-dependent dehydrogenase (short-subunit alcohol dehydrogenase family)
MRPLDQPIRVVTGATAGIGRALAQRLATSGAVALVGRDAEKLSAARREILGAIPAAMLEVYVADLSRMSDVRSLADQLSAAHPRIGALVNCAGVFVSSRVETVDGLELMFATNHLAPFLLTNLLLPSLRASGAARVLTVTAPSSTRLKFDDLQGSRRFGALSAFGASKAANLLFTFELARRVAGSGVTANAVHPGLARTSLMRQASPLLRVPIGLMSAPVDKVADGIAPLLLDDAYRSANGQFFHKGKAIDPPKSTRDDAEQRRLWEVSAQLTGLPQ